MPNNFNIQKDNELIAAGTHFWCSGHLGSMPVSKQSGDPRYCLACFDVLNDEVKLLKATGHFSKAATWTPTVSKEHVNKQANTLQEKSPDGIPQAGVLLPIKPTSTKTPATNTGGRPRKELPEEKILELFNAGVGVKAIGKQLGFSAMTVSRHLRKGAAAPMVTVTGPGPG